MGTKKQPESKDTLVLSIRFPKGLIKRIDRLADREMRTRANMIVYLLTTAADNAEKEAK